MKHEFHNPDNLTPEQIGVGYRLLSKSELIERWQDSAEYWSPGEKKWMSYGHGLYPGTTYRVPHSTVEPKPVIEGSHREHTDWIPWSGGECPLKDDEVKEWEIRFRDGMEFVSICKDPRVWSWAHYDSESDIVAYRVLKWKEKKLPAADTFPKAMEEVTQRESSPTDNDTWNSLLATNAQLGKKVAALEKKIERLNESIGYDPKFVNDLQSKLSAAQARLDQLEWRPISVKPTKEDANQFDYVTLTDGVHTTLAKIINFSQWDKRWTHWQPFAPPAEIDTNRVEFEKWWKARCDDRSAHKTNLEDAMFDAWKAAREERK